MGNISNKGNTGSYNNDIHSQPINIFMPVHYTAVWHKSFIKVAALLDNVKPIQA